MGVIPFVPPPNTDGQPGGSKMLDGILILLGNTLRSLALAVTNDILVPTTFDAVAFPAGQRVFHGMRQAPKTWEAVNVRAPGGVIYESAAPNASRSVYLILQSTTDVECLIRFT